MYAGSVSSSGSRETPAAIASSVLVDEKESSVGGRCGDTAGLLVVADITALYTVNDRRHISRMLHIASAPLYKYGTSVRRNGVYGLARNGTFWYLAFKSAMTLDIYNY